MSKKLQLYGFRSPDTTVTSAPELKGSFVWNYAQRTISKSHVVKF